MFDSVWKGRTEAVTREKYGLAHPERNTVLSSQLGVGSHFSVASLLPACHRWINVYFPQPVTRGDRCWESWRAWFVLRAPEGPWAPGLVMGCRIWCHLIKPMSSPISSVYCLRSSGSSLWAAVRAPLKKLFSSSFSAIGWYHLCIWGYWYWYWSVISKWYLMLPL